MEINRLGSDKINIHKAREMILIVVAIIVIGWYATNYPKLWDDAKTFLFLIIGAGLSVTFSFIINRTKLNFDVPLAEKPLFWTKRIIFIISAVGLLASFFFLARTGYAIESQDFQLVELGIGGDAILKIFAAIAEDVLFFAVVPGLIFVIVFYFTKENAMIALIFVVILTPSVFVTYHTLRYGFDDIVKTTAVFLFGLEMTGWMIVFRDLIYVHARHIGNNVGQLIFKQMTLGTFFILLLTSWAFWAIVIVIAILIYFRLRKK